MKQIAWPDLAPGLKTADDILMYDGTKPIPRTLTFCDSCGEWLPTSLEQKQTEELIAALRLVAAVPDFATARLEHADKPDVRVHLGRRVYGLEVTRIARDGDEIGRAKWRQAVQRRARLLRRERSDPPVWVSLMWNPNPPKADAHSVAQQLVALVDLRLATLPNTIHATADILPKDVPKALSPFVHGLHVMRTRADDQWVSGFANMPEVQPGELQQEIDSKAGKVAGYTSHPDGLWLLIYAEPSNAAQALDVTDEARAAEYAGPFDRVFFLDCMDKVAELHLR